jgi:hypothetical protein
LRILSIVQRIHDALVVESGVCVTETTQTGLSFYQENCGNTGFSLMAMPGCGHSNILALVTLPVRQGSS